MEKYMDMSPHFIGTLNTKESQCNQTQAGQYKRATYMIYRNVKDSKAF